MMLAQRTQLFDCIVVRHILDSEHQAGEDGVVYYNTFLFSKFQVKKSKTFTQ